VLIFTVALPFAFGAQARALTVSASGVPRGEIGIRLLDAPDSKGARSTLYVVADVQPGARITRRVQVTSGLAAPARVSLYAAGARVARGSIAFAPGRARNDLAGWMSITPSSVVVPAYRSVDATVTFTVPASARAGKRTAVVWAELPSATRNGITEINRVGVRAYFTVTGSAPLGFVRIAAMSAGAVALFGALGALFVVARRRRREPDDRIRKATS
jgi:hypothetical protein